MADEGRGQEIMRSLTGTPADWPSWFAVLNAACAWRQGPRRIDGATLARLTRARGFIDHHFDEPIDLELMARAACFSRFHFLREFRRTFEMTPHQYLTRQRIERAKQLLQQTDLSVTEVCLEVGYQSLGSFSSLFSRHVGHSPDRYRARRYRCPGIPTPLWSVPGCFVTMIGMAQAPRS